MKLSIEHHKCYAGVSQTVGKGNILILINKYSDDKIKLGELSFGQRNCLHWIMN